MKNQRTLLRFTACLILATIMIGCPLLTGIGSTPGWSFAGGKFLSGRDVVLLPDGGFFVAGESQWLSGDALRILALRVSADGQLLWTSDASAPVSSEITSRFTLAAPTIDGGAVLAGLDKELPAIGAESLLRVQWLDTFGTALSDSTIGPATHVPTSMIVQRNGDVGISTYMTTSGPINDGAFALVAADTGGTITAALGTSSTRLNRIAILPSGEFLTVGLTGVSSISTSGLHLIVWRLNSDGVSVGAQVYPNGDQMAEPRGLAINSENELLIAGTISQAATLWRIASDGTLINTKSFLGPLSTEIRETHDCWDIAMNPDGTMIVVGLQQFTTIGAGGFFVGDDNRNFVIKLDADANIIWRKDIPNVSLYGCDVGPDGTIAVTGSAGDDLALILLDQSGNIIN